ncbi:MAG: DUF2270 domain-containing protein [Candidatus Eiseniibacteriota bacterium]
MARSSDHEIGPIGRKGEIPLPEDTPPARVDLEGTHLVRSEYIAAMVHFYRGEMYRATQWRLRLDNTTNWSIIAAGGLLTFSFGHPESSPLILLLGQGIVFAFLWIESRRYRIFDVWRARVRKIEENFYNPILTRRLVSPDPWWGDAVAHDLAQPRFKMSRWHAMHSRLRANYLILFLILNTAWILKIFTHPTPTHSLGLACQRLDAGILPWQAIVGVVLAFYVALLSLYFVPGAAVTIRGREWGLGEEGISAEDR